MSPAEFGLSEYESMLLGGLNLSAGFEVGFGASYCKCDSLVLKEYCKNCGIDFLWAYSVFKRYANVLNRVED